MDSKMLGINARKLCNDISKLKTELLRKLNAQNDKYCAVFTNTGVYITTVTDQSLDKNVVQLIGQKFVHFDEANYTISTDQPIQIIIKGVLTNVSILDASELPEIKDFLSKKNKRVSVEDSIDMYINERRLWRNTI